MTASHTRTALFISHANPEDNAFARWLGAKLSALGYEVWADVMRLHGGADWSRELESALRQRSAKMLLVARPSALEKQGVRNEIQIGSDVGREIKDSEFIIPLRLAPYQAPFLIAHVQYIDFSRSWTVGFTELLDLLNEKAPVRGASTQGMEVWHQAQSEGAARLVGRKEYLCSSWLSFVELPEKIRFFEAPVGFPTERFQERSAHPWPIAPHAAGILSFACIEGDELAPGIPARLKGEYSTRAFLADGCKALNLDTYTARTKFSDLANQAFESAFRDRGLSVYEATGGRSRWWGSLKTYPLTKVSFQWPHRRSRRQLIGQSGKRKVHWHYSVNCQARTAPIPHFRLSAGLVFSLNGMDALDDVKRMHRLRRSFAKWRNARWRDMMLAFLWWLSKSEQQLALPVSNGQRMVVRFPPMSFQSPVTAMRLGEELPDEDDPDIEYDFEDGDVVEDESEREDEVEAQTPQAAPRTHT
jgi:hypothetical protein